MAVSAQEIPRDERLPKNSERVRETGQPYSAMDYFSIFMITAFCLGLTTGLMVAVCCCATTNVKGPCEIPDVAYVSRAGKCYHLAMDCSSMTKNENVATMLLCQHCSKNHAKKTHKAKTK